MHSDDIDMIEGGFLRIAKSHGIDQLIVTGWQVIDQHRLR